MPRHALEFLAEILWSMWAWPAIEAAGDWPFFLFAALCCAGGLALGGGLAATRVGELRAATAPTGRLQAAVWVAGRLAGATLGVVLAAGGGWGLLCLARVGWLSL